MAWQFVCLHGTEKKPLGQYKTLREMQRDVKEKKPQSPEFFTLMIYRYGPSGDVYRIKLNGQEFKGDWWNPEVKGVVTSAWTSMGGTHA